MFPNLSAARLRPRLARQVLVLGLAPALMIMVFSAVVSAHGGGTPQLTDVDAGPYRLFVWTQPEPWRVGEVHVTVAVTLPPADHADGDEGEQTAEPAEDVEVIVRFTGPDGRRASTNGAPPHSSLGAGYYEVDTILDEEGEWRVQVALSGAEGSGSAEFIVEVLPARTYFWAWAAAALVIVSALLLWRVRRSRSTESNDRVVVSVSKDDRE